MTLYSATMSVNVRTVCYEYFYPNAPYIAASCCNFELHLVVIYK